MGEPKTVSKLVLGMVLRYWAVRFRISTISIDTNSLAQNKVDHDLFIYRSIYCYHASHGNLHYMQAVSMFLIVYAITVPLDEGSSHILSILGTLMYVHSFPPKEINFKSNIMILTENLSYVELFSNIVIS